MTLHKNDLEDNIPAYIRDRLPNYSADILFDVGANHGWFTRQFLLSYPEIKVHAFEPVSTIHDYMRTNLLKHVPGVQLDRLVQTHRMALGDRNYSAHVTATPNTTTNKVTDDQSENTEPTIVARGDTFCKEHGIDRISFLKIDTEGFDMNVLHGFHEMLLGQHIDFIQVEAGMDILQSNHTFHHDFQYHLKSYGYQLFRYANQASGQLPYLKRADIVFISDKTIMKNKF